MEAQPNDENLIVAHELFFLSKAIQMPSPFIKFIFLNKTNFTSLHLTQIWISSIIIISPL
jgi:hypothetical protein